MLPAMDGQSELLTGCRSVDWQPSTGVLDSSSQRMPVRSTWQRSSERQSSGYMGQSGQRSSDRGARLNADGSFTFPRHAAPAAHWSPHHAER